MLIVFRSKSGQPCEMPKNLLYTRDTFVLESQNKSLLLQTRWWGEDLLFDHQLHCRKSSCLGFHDWDMFLHSWSNRNYLPYCNNLLGRIASSLECWHFNLQMRTQFYRRSWSFNLSHNSMHIHHPPCLLSQDQEMYLRAKRSNMPQHNILCWRCSQSA